MNESETLDMLKVKTLGPLFNMNAHLKEIRGNLDKVQKYAVQKFGYQPDYIKENKYKTYQI